MKSIQFRLSIGLFISLVFMFFLVWWLANSSIRYLTEEHIISHMAHDAESIISAISFDANNKLNVDVTQVEPVFQRPFSGQYYSLIINGTIINSKSLGGHVLDISPPSVGGVQHDYQIGPIEQPLIVVMQTYQKQGQQFTLSLAEDLSPTLAEITRFKYRFTIITLLCLITLIIIQVIILRRGFMPLKRIQSQIRDLEAGERNQLDANVPQEVAPLVYEINSLQKVLERRIQNSRNALGDLAHAFKTPLTVLQQLANEPILQAHPELQNMLITQTENMQKTTNHVLKKARFAGVRGITSVFNLDSEMRDLLNAFTNIYRDKKPDIKLNIPVKVNLAIDREDMLELLGNLLDNACKWCESSVSVHIKIDPAFCLIIEDDGPGVSEQFIEVLSKRGMRLDESINGYGLGLSIVKSIVEQYNGTIKFGRSTDLYGFLVEVNLPLKSL